MFNSNPYFTFGASALALSLLTACGGANEEASAASGTQPAARQVAAPKAAPLESAHPNSIQPETTLTLTATGTVDVTPDIAFLTAGVNTQGATAEAAMSSNAKAMNGVFGALDKAGIDKSDMQTSNFSLQPRYDYSKNGNREPKIIGYNASNQLTVIVRELETLGETMDALVSAGGNTFSGFRFALEDDSGAMDEARQMAIREAITRAELYAETAGFDVARIVTIKEASRSAPQPLQFMQARAMQAETTPIAAGEIGYSVNVTVTFELRP